MKTIFVVLSMFLVCTAQASLKKNTRSYTLIAYVEQKTADFFGGRQAVEDSIYHQLNLVNTLFNAQPDLTDLYQYTAVAFHYYTDNSTDDSTLFFYSQASETACDYRIVYNAFPQRVENNQEVHNYFIAFSIESQSVIFSYKEAAAGNGPLFGRVMTNVLFHELCHSRGAWDLWAGKISGNSNAVKPGLGWTCTTASVMNDDYTYTILDPYSTYLINKTSALYGNNTFTSEQRAAITHDVFPNTIRVQVLTANGSAASNALVQFYAVPWFPGDAFSLANVTYTRQSDANGHVDFTGATANPFDISYGSPNTFSLFVSVTYNGQTRYDWISFYEVSNTFINGLNMYTKTISFASVNKAPMVSIGNSGNLIHTAPVTFSVPVTAYDSDGTIASVDLYDNGVYMATATYYPNIDTYWMLNYPGLTEGTHLITAVATDQSGASSTSGTLRVDVLPNPVTTALASSTIQNINVYPNPSNGEVVVSGTTDATRVRIDVLNSNGVCVWSEEIRSLNGIFQTRIDLETYTDGLYLIKAAIDQAVLIQKLIKK